MACQKGIGVKKAMATHSSILVWRIPWTEEPVGYSPRGCKESDMTEQLSISMSPTKGVHGV